MLVSQADVWWQMVITRDRFFYPTLIQVMGSFSCSSLNTSFYIGKKTWKRLPENLEYTEMRHGDIILILQWRNRLMCGQPEAKVWPFFFYLFHGLVLVCEIELSHIGKNNENPNVVCEKRTSVFLSWVRNSYLTHVILPKLSREDCSLVVLKLTCMVAKWRQCLVNVMSSCDIASQHIQGLL